MLCIHSVMFGSDLFFYSLDKVEELNLDGVCVASHHWFNSSICCRKTNIYPSIYTRNMYSSNTPLTLSFQE